jgi:hypothetical protein
MPSDVARLTGVPVTLHAYKSYDTMSVFAPRDRANGVTFYVTQNDARTVGFAIDRCTPRWAGDDQRQLKCIGQVFG